MTKPKAKAMKKAANKLYAHVVLDRSGSMSSCWRDTLGGLNAYYGALDPADKASLTLFDTVSIDLVRDAVAPKDATVKDGEFLPRGGTPLYDAIGRTVGEIAKRAEGYDRVALVILTDGYENASREFTRDSIAKLLKEKQDKDNWLVIYLGANQDAWAVGSTFGTVTGQTMSFDPQNVRQTFMSATRATQSYAVAPSAIEGRTQAAFTAAERKAAKK